MRFKAKRTSIFALAKQSDSDDMDCQEIPSEHARQHNVTPPPMLVKTRVNLDISTRKRSVGNTQGDTGGESKFVSLLQKSY